MDFSIPLYYTLPVKAQLTCVVNMKAQIQQGSFNPYSDVAGITINNLGYYELAEREDWGVYFVTLNDLDLGSYSYNYMINSEQELVPQRNLVLDTLFNSVFDWYNDECIMPPTMTIDPPDATGWDELTLTIDGSLSCFESSPLAGASQVYMHSGVTLEGGGYWTHTINWDGVGANGQLPVLASNGDGTFSITYTPAEFYGIAPGEQITDLCAVFNGGGWGIDGRDYTYTGYCMDYFIPMNIEAVSVVENESWDIGMTVYPNPAFSEAEISYRIGGQRSAVGGQVRITLHDLTGKQIKVLVDEFKAPGEYTRYLDTSALPAGIYFLQLRSGEVEKTEKVVVMR
jgi:hypothetical protein